MSRLLSVLALGALGGLVACGGKKQEAESASDVAEGARPDERSRCEFEGRDDRDLRESTAPGSVKPNIRRVYGYIGSGEDRRRVLLCREVDSNFDGVKDVVRTYDDQGETLTEQADTNFDGTIDTYITFADGRISKVELDQDEDGKVEEVKFYTDDIVSRAERDTNGDGKADIFEVYREGNLVRMGIDVDHDGQVDRWDRDEVLLRREAEEAAEESEPKAEAGDEG